MEWNMKYAPKNPGEYAGSKKIIQMMMNFIDKWIEEVPLKKAIILHGVAGNGKTSLVYALKELYNLNIIEVNASDRRNANDIKALRRLTGIGAFDGQFTVMLLDEVDGLNAWAPFESLIEQTQCPLILTCNDADKIPYTVSRECMVLEVEYPPVDYVARRLTTILETEKRAGCITDLQLYDKAIKHKVHEIASKCISVRSAILTLQSCITEGSFKDFVVQDIGYSEYEKIRRLFCGESDDCNLPPETILKWAKKNDIPTYDLQKLIKVGREYPGMQDIVKAYAKTLRGKPDKLLSPYYKLVPKSKKPKPKPEIKFKARKEKQAKIETVKVINTVTFDDDDMW